MNNHRLLELPMSITNFHGPKEAQAIEDRLYIFMVTFNYFAGDGDWVKVPSVQSDGMLDVGGITVNVKQGDITESKEDCIINSSNEDLDLSRGNSTSLRKQAYSNI